MKVHLTHYDPIWPERFQQEKKLLAAALQPLQAQIEHMGSTAVPGLAAKPIIDIMIGLEDFAQADTLIPIIQKLGYDYDPEWQVGMPERRYFVKRQQEVRTHHIHMVEAGSEFWNRHLMFRNYLRNNPHIRDEYASLKWELVKRDWQELNDYANAKTAFIRRVEAQARSEIG